MKNLLRRIDRMTAVQAVRNGLVNMIPIVIVGAFALILKTLPVTAYQNAIAGFADGLLVTLFDIVFHGSFGLISLYMTYSISRSYMELRADPEVVGSGAVAAALVSFFILAGANLPGFGLEETGAKSMFLAIVTALGTSRAYLFLARLQRRSRRQLFSTGATRNFNQMLFTMMPIAVIVLTVAVLNLAVTRLFEVSSVRELLSRAFNRLFSIGKMGFFKGFFFVLLSSVLWLFGIHGSDTLEGVMQTYFTPGLAANQAAVTAGTAPTHILTKQFFDCFVLMGGCGATICLLIALLAFSRSRARRGLALTAAFPMLFNINELMVFGLPIVFSPIMAIPFLTVPLVCYSLAYLATVLGLVPVITGSVEWTTPILLGGYQATGSVAGALLQVVNVCIGVAIYAPFVRLLERRVAEESRETYAAFMSDFRANETALAGVRLTERPGSFGELAKELSAELRHAVDCDRVRLAYMPQYRYDGTCCGVEALLRWTHVVYGQLYPPLVIKLARDGGFLEALEESVIRKAAADRPRVEAKFGKDVVLSFNVTGSTVAAGSFLQVLRQLDAQQPLRERKLCLEVTEQDSLEFDEKLHATFDALRDLGVELAIDDFSMGQTSLNYLKDNLFDVIKLDGSLVKGLETHENCREIISSIVQLSGTLHLTVLAEYVETEREREILHQIGCDCYQGYLYSPAVFLD